MRMRKQTKRDIVKTERATGAVVDSAFYGKVRDVFEQARQFVRTTANFAMVKAYWLVGKMIVEKQGGAAKAAYGDGLIDELSRRLTKEFGAGFKRVNLFNMRRFFLSFPKVHTLCEQLSWSHYRLLISVENEEARQYYLDEARKSLWSVRELQRQINSFYYERLFENRAKGRRPSPLHAADAQQANLRRKVQVALAKRTGVDSRTPPRTHSNRRRTARRQD